MIKEDTMIKIAERFFERENIKPIRQKTGVDFIFQGKVIEVKGSNSKFDVFVPVLRLCIKILCAK
jgi:hypothetical protein